MLEAYLSSFSVAFIQSGVAAALCFYVVCDRLNKGRIVIFLQALLFVCLFSCTFSIFTNQFTEDYFLPISGVYLFCGWCYLCKVTDENRIWLFFLGSMIFSFLSFCSSITFLIYAIWEPQYTSGLYVYEDIPTFGIPILFFVFPFAWIMRKLYKRMRMMMIANLWRICIIPLLFALCLILQSVFLPSDTIGVIESCFLKGFIIFCSFLTYSQMIGSLTNAEKVIREQENTKFLLHQFDLQKSRIEDLEAHAEEMRRIRHDRKHHVEVLKGLLSKNEIAKAREYLNDYENSISKDFQPPLCDNFAADAICRRYQTLAKQAGIKTELSLTLSNNPGVSGSDLAVILGNLWENAIAAALDAATDNFIQFKVLERDDKIFIRMENSFENIVIQDDGKYLSTKAGRNYAEGIGLSSIKAAAAKYGGIADFSHNQQVFTSSVLLYRHNS